MVGLFGYISQSFDCDKLRAIVNNMGYVIKETNHSPSCLLFSLDINSSKPIETSVVIKKDVHIVSCGEVYNEDRSDLKKDSLVYIKLGTCIG